MLVLYIPIETCKLSLLKLIVFIAELITELGVNSVKKLNPFLASQTLTFPDASPDNKYLLSGLKVRETIDDA